MQADFERDLATRIRIRRLITSCLALTFLAMLILCVILWETTKEVIIHNSPYSILPLWTEVKHNNNYIFPMISMFLGTIVSSIILIVDLLMGGFRTVYKDQHCITLYRGIRYNMVYVNGEEKGRKRHFHTSNVIEVWLPNGVRVTVSFSRATWYMAHISFSDDTASREV